MTNKPYQYASQLIMIMLREIMWKTKDSFTKVGFKNGDGTLQTVQCRNWPTAEELAC
jgi:hypothetical protein